MPESTHTSEAAELAFGYLQRGDLTQAAHHAEVALSLEPDDPSILALSAIVDVQRKRMLEAEAKLRRALELDALHLEALVTFSKLLAASRRLHEGIAYAETAVLTYPDDADIWMNLGLLLVQGQRFDDAVTAFRKATAANPKSLKAKQLTAAALFDAGREHESIEAYQELVKLDKRNLSAWISLSKALLAHGRFKEAVEAGQHAVDLDKLNPNAHLVLALALAEDTRGSEAETHLRRAVKLNPNDGLAKAALGYWYQEEGRFPESLDILGDALKLVPNHGFAYYNFFRAKKATEVEPAMLDDLVERAEDPKLHIRDRTYINYALGKAFEDLKNFEKSIHYFDEGNRCAYETWLAKMPWQRDDYRNRFTRSIETFTESKLDELSQRGLNTDLPLIIVGMMRSGTSLLEQILSSHPDVVGAGELPFWHDHEEEAYDEAWVPNAEKIRSLGQRYLKDLQILGGNKKRVTDKLPHNYAMLGLIHTAFPKAKIIHVKRSPADNCLSIYTTAYQRPPVFAHDRDNIVFAYREYQRIIAHWRQVLPPNSFMEVQYEEIVADREGWTRRLIEFAGLPWDDACLHHEKNQRAVRTPSLWQVRQPIYNTSIERWRRFEPWIPEFAALTAED